MDLNRNQLTTDAPAIDNPDLDGAPVRTETGAAELSWRERRRTSVRWTGTLTAPETGEDLFGFVSNQGYRIWVNGQLMRQGARRLLPHHRSDPARGDDLAIAMITSGAARARMSELRGSCRTPRPLGEWHV
jgi:hypothetical protein